MTHTSRVVHQPSRVPHPWLPSQGWGISSEGGAVSEDVVSDVWRAGTTNHISNLHHRKTDKTTTQHTPQSPGQHQDHVVKQRFP